MKASDAQVLCTKETPQGWTPSKYSLEDQQQYKELFATMPFDPNLHAFFLEEKKRETKERNEATRHQSKRQSLKQVSEGFLFRKH